MKYIALVIALSLSLGAYSQQVQKCGYSYLYNEVAGKYPIVNPPPAVAYKTTADSAVTIPVVFHIVLTKQQQNAIGTEQLLRRFIDSQVAAVTRDFNAMNRDSQKIPAPFKPLFGNARISFALARTAPDGSASPGYDLVTTNKQAFSFTTNTAGSGAGFSDAKYAVSGGLDAWDPTTYLNIWIINSTDNQILGLCIPPSFAYQRNFPLVETGVVLNYRNWLTPIASFRGRTLTHELGHFFELRHIWGDDEGKCPATGGADDGIDDTPIQSYENYGCPKFPKVDGCTPSAPGIMFMNYMDYTADTCQHMFTLQQVAVMRAQVAPFAYSYSLTQHPAVLQAPASGTEENKFTIYPNPGDGRINIRFSKVSSDVQSIRITNTLGQQVIYETIEDQKGFYYYDLSHAGSGIYFIQIAIAGKIHKHKIVIN